MLSKLKKLQELYLSGSPQLQKDYWTHELLEIYASTLGERISWKWQHCLEDLKKQNIHPENLFPKKKFLLEDWACGPGTASLKYLENCDHTQNYKVKLVDRSSTACAFAQKKIKECFHIEFTESQNEKDSLHLQLISYVLSELSALSLAQIVEKLKKTDLFIWIDASSIKESHQLSRVRDSLLEEFYFLAPCPHQKECPVLKTKNDWCHRFAKAPTYVFHDSDWSKISKELKIDLRSLPYHSLYGVKKTLFNNPPEFYPADFNNLRLLGRPRVGKHEAKADFCTPEGAYKTLTFTKRKDPEFYKLLKYE
jgi:ribosomal protein RSM22 (predicted rRNA methylase)